MAKSSLKKRRAKAAARRLSKNPGPLKNPPIGTDMLHVILPGFGSYAATRLLNRIVYVQMSKRFPKLAKHAPVASSILSFLALWFLAHKVKRLEKWHDPLVLGSAIAGVQTIFQTYVPKYGWIVSDVSADQYRSSGASRVAELRKAGIVPVRQLQPATPGADILEDDEYYEEEATAEEMAPESMDEDLVVTEDDDDELDDLSDDFVGAALN